MKLSDKSFLEEYNELYMKFAKVLDYATGSCISKPETDINIIYESIDRKIQREIDYALEDERELNAMFD